MLLVVKVQDIGPVDGTKLDMPDSVAGQNVDLLQGILGNLVRESTEANHRVLPVCRTTCVLPLLAMIAVQ